MAQSFDVLNPLYDQLAEQYDVIARTVLKGSLTFEDYKRLTGTLQGLDHAQMLVTQMSKRVTSGEDDE